MNKRELAERLAKESQKSQARAADDVDSLVYGLLKDMRQQAKNPVIQKTAVATPKPPSVSQPVAKKAAGPKK